MISAYCHSKEALPNLCSLITGDALLYSMFRVEASPVQCPFRGPFTFSYNRGHGECKSPPSSVDSCTEDSRLLLRYQACPDVSGTESTGEFFFCSISNSRLEFSLFHCQQRKLISDRLMFRAVVWFYHGEWKVRWKHSQLHSKKYIMDQTADWDSFFPYQNGISDCGARQHFNRRRQWKAADWICQLAALITWSLIGRWVGGWAGGRQTLGQSACVRADKVKISGIQTSQHLSIRRKSKTLSRASN